MNFMVNKVCNSPKRTAYTFVLLQIVISLIILPFAQREDFSLLFTWRLFELKAPKTALDITWGSGNDTSFFLRAYYKKETERNKNYTEIAKKLYKGKFNKITEEERIAIFELCQCETPRLITIKSRLADHIISQKPPQISSWRAF